MLVIKIGGGAGLNHSGIFTNLRSLIERGERAVVVHGGNREMAVLSDRLHLPVKMITSVSGYESRYTDAMTMEAFIMAYCGKVNKTLVALCHSMGINAVGLSGLDGGLLRGPRKSALKIVEGDRTRIIRDDLSGKVEHVNVELLRLLIDHGYLPLVSPPAISLEHEPINVDGDRAAARIASALGAERLIVLSNVPGLLREVSDEGSLIGTIGRTRMSEFEGLAKGRMKKKLMGAMEAIDGGVKEVILADARCERPLDDALAGRGTVIR